jgi:hypothetical protein
MNSLPFAYRDLDTITFLFIIICAQHPGSQTSVAISFLFLGITTTSQIPKRDYHSIWAASTYVCQIID